MKSNHSKNELHSLIKNTKQSLEPQKPKSLKLKVQQEGWTGVIETIKNIFNFKSKKVL